MANKSGSILPKISEFVGELGGWMNIIRTVFGHSGPSGEGKQDTGMKANFMGVGMNDETLFWEAVALAEAKDWMKIPTGRENISAILKKLSYWEKSRFYQMIGKDSQSVTIEIHTKTSKPADSTQTPLTGRRRSKTAGLGDVPDPTDEEKARIEKTTMNGNMRGAMIVAFFAGMEPTDAVAFLKNSGTLTGTTDDIKKIYGELSKFLGKVKLQQTLDKMGVETEKMVLHYFDAPNILAAERKVVAREQEVAIRRAQTWVERDLKHHPNLIVFWAVLGGISIIGFIYTFISH